MILPTCNILLYMYIYIYIHVLLTSLTYTGTNPLWLALFNIHWLREFLIQTWLVLFPYMEVGETVPLPYKVCDGVFGQDEGEAMHVADVVNSEIIENKSSWKWISRGRGRGREHYNE